MLSTENIGLKKPGYNDEADIAVVNENMDVIDAELSNRYPKSQTYSNRETDEAIATAINALPRGLIYRGAVDYYNNLPSENNELGDTYSIKYQGTSGTETDGNEYAWGEYDGILQWIKLGVNAYNKDEIDAMHDEMQTEIDANKSDILSAENGIAVNRTTLGTQKKNLLDFEKFLTEREATFTKEGDEYTVTTNSALNTQKYYFAEENTRVIISGILTNVTSSNARISLIDTNGNVVNGYAIDATHTSTVSVAAGLKFDWSSTGRFKINELMIRPADITDDAYEPYKPSLQEQINDLYVRNSGNITATIIDNANDGILGGYIAAYGIELWGTVTTRTVSSTKVTGAEIRKIQIVELSDNRRGTRLYSNNAWGTFTFNDTAQVTT